MARTARFLRPRLCATHLGLFNGTRGTITAIDQRARRLAVTTDHHATVTIPFAYADAGSLTYGYAMTIHKAEGATVAIALVLADVAMTRQHLYTAVSRGSQRNVIYLSTDDLRADMAQVVDAARKPIQVLIGIIDRTDAKEMAIEAPELTL